MPVLTSDYSGYSYATSGKKIIKRAMRLIGATDPDAEPDANEIATGLEALNKMIDSWNGEGQMLYALEMFSVDVSARSPSIGPGATLDMPRPDGLVEGQVFLKTSITNYRLRQMTQREWAAVEADTVSEGTPSKFYYDEGSPTGVLNFNVTPDTTYTLEVYAPTLLAQITNASAVFTLPPSYADALDHNLAVRIAPEFGQEVPATVAELAVSLKAKILRKNLRIDTVKPDLGVGSSRYDIRSDRYL